MSIKKTTDEIAVWEDLHLRGILDYVPHSNEPREYSEGYDILAMIDGYENEGREILKAGGYPLTVREIIHSRFDKDGIPLGKKPLPRRVRDVMNMFTYFRQVRYYIQKNDISWALCFMAYGVQAAMKARIRPVEPLIKKGKDFTEKKDIAYTKTVKKNKGIREAFVRRLIVKYQRLNSKQLWGKILDEARAIDFKHDGVDYMVYRIERVGRAGKKNLYVYFRSELRSFKYAMHTFLDTVDKIKNLQ